MSGGDEFTVPSIRQKGAGVSWGRGIWKGRSLSNSAGLVPDTVSPRLRNCCRSSDTWKQNYYYYLFIIEFYGLADLFSLHTGVQIWDRCHPSHSDASPKEVCISYGTQCDNYHVVI